MANVLVRIDVQNQIGPAPLNGVTVRVYEDDGTTFITEGVTGPPFATGRVEFTLFGDNPGVDYILRFSLNGWRFPAGATQTITVTDPPAPDNDFGPYNALQGPTAVIAQFVISDDTLAEDPIENVQIFVYDNSDAYLTQVNSDSNGEAELPLVGSATPGTDYIVRLRKDGVIFDDPTQTVSILNPLTPPQTNIFDFTGHVIEIPESLDPDMCTVYGYFTDVSLLPVRRLKFEFKPMPQFIETGVYAPAGSSRLLGVFNSDPSLVRDRILTRSVKGESDKDGFISVELPREGHFEVHIHGLEDPIEITERIYIPNAASARLIDLLYPFVQSVVVDTDPISVAEGESVQVGITVTLSSTEVITDINHLQDLIEITVDDDTIAEATLFSGEEITVKGLQAGSTTVVVTRKEDPIVPSRPPVAALVFTPPVVNVT